MLHFDIGWQEFAAAAFLSVILTIIQECGSKKLAWIVFWPMSLAIFILSTACGWVRFT